MGRIKVATIWLGGCSGCHMSLLDLDEWLFELAKHVEIVYSPIADVKEFPEGVDVTLVEGAVTNEDNLEILRTARQRSNLIVGFGDCAVTGNVPAMRNMLGRPQVPLEATYLREPDTQPQIPHEPGVVPELLPRVRPLHEFVTVDAYIPGCPPPAPRIKAALEHLLDASAPALAGRELLKFG